MKIARMHGARHRGDTGCSVPQLALARAFQ